MRRKEKVISTIENYDKNIDGEWLRSWSLPTGVPYLRETFHSLSGVRWTRLIKRCSPTLRTLESNSGYEGSVNGFYDFQEFVKWSQSEYGYSESTDGRMWPLDKDLYRFGNRVYSPETCIFVPQRVNSFTSMSSARRGDYPVGVHLATGTIDTFISRCFDNGRSANLGRYSCPIAAHRAWQLKKVSVGRLMADNFKNIHPKLYRNLNTWVDSIDDDHSNNRITEIAHG